MRYGLKKIKKEKVRILLIEMKTKENFWHENTDGIKKYAGKSVPRKLSIKRKENFGKKIRT